MNEVFCGGDLVGLLLSPFLIIGEPFWLPPLLASAKEDIG